MVVFYIAIMKYILFLAAFALLQVSSIAQEVSTEAPKSYSTFVGGTFSLRSEIRDDPARFFYEKLSVGVNPYIGLDFSSKLSAGVSLNYSYRNRIFNNSFDGGETIKTRTFGGGLFVRNYLNEGAFQFFLETQVSYSRIRETIEGASIDLEPRKSGVFSAGITPTLSYRINRLRLLASFGSFSYSSFSDTTFDFNGEEITEEEGFSLISLDIRPRFFSFGAEFLF
jgi:hypothetical protein